MKSNMSKKLVALILCLMMVAAMAAGCGSSKNTPGQSSANDTSTAANTTAGTSAATTKAEPSPVTIVVGDWPKESDEARLKLYKDYIQKCNELYPYITIKSDGWNYDVMSFLPKAASGQLPNIYTTYFTESSKIIDGNYAADVTDTMKAFGYDTAFNPSMLKLLEKNGRYYGFPAGGFVMGMWYDVGLFKQAGLLDDKGVPKFPKTYDELVQTAKTIKEKTGKAGFFFPAKSGHGGWYFMDVAWSYGAEFEKKVDGKWQAVFNSPEAVAALQYIKDLKWKYDVIQSNILSDVNDMFKLFGTDQVGMTFGLTDWISVPVTNYKMSKDNMAMSPLPAGPKGAVSLLGGSLFMFSPNSTPEQLDAAFKWLEIIGYTTKTSQDALDGLEKSYKTANEQGQIVGPTGLQIWANSERLEVEKAIVKKYTNVNMDLWTPFTTDTGNTIRPEEPLNCQELYQALDAVVQAVLTDKNADPKKMLDRAVEDFQKNYLDKANQ